MKPLLNGFLGGVQIKIRCVDDTSFGGTEQSANSSNAGNVHQVKQSLGMGQNCPVVHHLRHVFISLL